MKNLSLIILALLFSASLTPAQRPAATPKKQDFNAPPQVSEIPLPCPVTPDQLPDFFGIKLGMPMPDAKKLYARVPQQEFQMDGEVPPNFAAMDVPARYLRKNTLGMPLEKLDFASMLEPQVESINLQFTSRQTLASKAMFEKLAKKLNIAPEMWMLVDHGNGDHMSWRTYCEGFQATFDAQRGLFYRLWISRIIVEREAPSPVGDGE